MIPGVVSRDSLYISEAHKKQFTGNQRMYAPEIGEPFTDGNASQVKSYNNNT